MPNGLKEDFTILKKFISKNFKFYFDRMLYPFKKTFNKKKVENQTLVETLLELEGAKRLGGEFLGKKIILNFTVLLYNVRRSTTDGSPSYYYIAYILRNNNYQVAIVDKWDELIPTIEKAITNNEKAIIGIRRREGEFQHVKSRSKQGRKTL